MNGRISGPPLFSSNWSVVARNLAAYLLITVLCIAALGFLAVRFSSDHILRQISIASMKTLESKTAILDERMAKVDGIIFQTMYDENTFRLIWSGDTSASSLLIMRDVIRDFEGIVRSHDWITSVYFFDSRHDYVLAETKTNKASFPDQTILTAPKRDELSLIGPRTLGSHSLLTFARSFPFFSRRLTGYVVVNVGYEAFFDTLAPGTDGSRFVVVDELGDIVYPRTAAPLGADPTAVLAAHTAGTTVTIDADRYAVVQDRTDVLGWRVLYLQPHGQAVRAAALVRRLILVSVAGVVILAGVLLWLATRRLQEPLSVIVKRARGLVGAAGREQNDYEIVDTAIRQLLSKNLELNERYRAALPYFRKYSIEEFLHTKSWDTERFDAILSMLGVHLRRSHLHVAIVESRRPSDGSLLRRTVETYLRSHEETVGFVAAETHDGRVALIVSTDSDAHTVYIVLSGLRDFLGEQGYDVSLAMSGQFGETAGIPDHFAEAEEQLEHRAFFGDDAVIYDFNRSETPTDSSPELPVDDVIEAVRAQDSDRAVEALAAYSREIGKRSEGRATYARFAFFELAIAIDGVLPNSAREEPEADRRRHLYSVIHDSSHTDELATILEELITSTIRELHRFRSEHHEDLVRRSIDYLEQHLAHSISVEDVAEAVFISSRYLNTIFKTHTGSTVFEYLSSLRIRRAEELLKDPSLQVQEIAARVGYVNVQSFTRLFKRHHGMTPVEYRRAAGQTA